MERTKPNVNILNEVDGIEIFSLVDNTVDFSSTPERKEVMRFRKWAKERHGKKWMQAHTDLPMAEHGFSMFIRLLDGDQTTNILFDTGCGSDTVVENSRKMGLNLPETDYIILSHGHYDHCGGLLSVLQTINKPETPLIVHEDMFRKRGTANADGWVRPYPLFPKRSQLDNARLIFNSEPLALANESVLITGEIPRKTNFEKGYLAHRTMINNSWIPDPLVNDERAIVFKIKNKGLVLISGCAHAGIINTINYAKEITDISRIFAVLGGFHLAGKENEGRIRQTVEALKTAEPEIVVPSHCTGWRAIKNIADSFPDGFIWNSVGNLYKF